MLNDKPMVFNTYSDKPLNLLLTEETDITSIVPGCGDGHCGNCVVLIDDKPRLSCLIPAFSVIGKRIMTFEGFAKSRFYTDIRRAYEKHDVQPCSHCYASKTLIIHALLLDSIDPDPEEILQALAANTCTCTCISRSELLEVVKTAVKFRRRKRRVRRS